jgi:peptidoglycan hydrolase CwlO-like protein
MFNFSHTEQELRDIIQALESRIVGMQKHLQALLNEANKQAAAQAEAPAQAPAVQPVAATASPSQSQPADPTAPIAVN